MCAEGGGAGGAAAGGEVFVVTDPRLLVEVRYGKLAGTKVHLQKGKSLRVGRTDLADLVVPSDGQMSGAHFELFWDGSTCKLKDLGSVTGTRLGGLSVTEADVPQGGWIQAGETDFLVYVEGKTPPRRVAAGHRAAEQTRRAAAERALSELRAEAEQAPLYAVVDGARDRRVLELCREHVETHHSLYEGAQGENFEDMAPFLVGPMRRDSALLDALVFEGWGKRFCIYVTSHEKFLEVRRHFRRFLMVELEPSHEQVYFRFYDPGVFRAFWPTCSPAQKRELSEKLSEIFVEEADLSLSALIRKDRARGRA